MKSTEFANWLRQEKHMAEDAIRSRVGNCNRVDQIYDLDKQYSVDGCEGLLIVLSYSKKAEKIGAPSLHKIEIKGNLYDGSATLKAAVKLYAEFMHETRS